MPFFSSDKNIFEKLLGERTIQVIERDGRRELRFGNHITQSAISLQEPERLLLEYTRAMMVGFLFVRKPVSILHIGLGAGSLPRFIHLHFPACRQVVVENYSEVIEVAFRYFFLPLSPKMQVIEEEGKTYLAKAKGRFDLIFLDAFLAEGAPGQVETVPFFETAREHLAPGGWLVNNVWGSDQPNLKRVTANLVLTFANLYALPVHSGSNVIFFCGKSGSARSQAELLQAAKALADNIPVDFEKYIKKLGRVRPRVNRPAARQQVFA
ncbi:MAG: fused MFS/spermidine synthase [SAR324 cluster bacterium]|nr:fused MFS/spermidine synthase [SAR324 cluster bacterium]